MKIKKFLAAVVSLVMILTMLPSTAFAEDGTTGDTELTGSMKLTKTAKLQEDGTYTIDLEAYSTGSTTTTQTTEKVPLDIVLVLDQSGSMDKTMSGRTSRLTALRNAANSFIASVQTDAEQYSLNHKIAVVGFASGNSSESSTGWENTELLSTSSTVPYNLRKNATSSSITVAQYQEALVSANVNGKINSRLTTAVSRADASGATYINYGLEMAKGVLDNRTETTYVKTDGSVADRKTVVIVFTDGVPGRYTDDRYGFQDNDQEDYNQISVANKALSIADEIKGSGTTVYSIGIFSGANPSANYNFSISTYKAGSRWDSRYVTYYNTATQAANAFLHFLSSDYTKAVNMTTPVRTTVVNNGYYLAASNADDLSEVFKGIAGSITESGTTVKLTADSVMKDIMADGFDASNANVEVTTFEAEMSDAGESVVKGDPTATANTLTSNISGDGKTVTVTGFDYSTKFVADEHPGEILHVTITGVIPTDDAVIGEIIGTNNEKSGIYENSEAADPAEFFEMPNTILTEKSYVLDFGKQASLKGMDQDTSVNAVVNTMKSVNANDDSVTGKYGNTNLADGSVTYAPKTTNWNGYDSFYVFGVTSNAEIKAASANADGYLWSKVNVIPATSVYYEDDFGYTSEDRNESDIAAGYTTIKYDGNWSIDKEGQSSGDTQSSDNIVYGTDTSYDNNYGYSDGSATGASKAGAKATFTFTGTGLDIYTSTNSESGLVLAQIKGKNHGKIYTAIIDNEFVSNEETGLYQIPTISFQNVVRDTYDVTLTVGSDTDGNSTYYLDAIRVYNPIEESDSVVSDAYTEAGEANSKTVEVRDELIDAGSLGTVDETTAGVAYIDMKGGSTANIDQYENYGPKNEVYIESGKGIAFQLGEQNYEKVFLGIKAPEGQSSVDITAGNEALLDEDITSATDMYYEITPTDEGYVVIKNTGDKLISITKLRVTGVTDTDTQDIELQVTPELLSYAASFASLPYVDEVENPDENTGDVTIENPEVPETETPSDTETGHNTVEDVITNVVNSLWNSIWNGFSSWFSRW